MDEDDKVRRNLVVFSAGLVLLLWLEIPLQPILKEQFHIASPNGTRAWVAAFVVLVYLTLRYRFSEKAVRIREQVLQLAHGVIYAGASRMLQKQIKAALEAGIPIPSTSTYKFVTDLEALNNLAPKSLPEAAQSLRSQNYEITSVSVKMAHHWYCAGHFEVILSSSQPLAQVKVLGLFQMRPSERLLVMAPVGPSLAYSATAINLLLPYVLAVFALGVIVNRMIDSMA